MKKLSIFIMTVILLVFPAMTIHAAAQQNSQPTSKTAKPKIVEIEYETKDNFVISAELQYPPTKEKVYPLVILLHSIGGNSTWWGDLASKFNEAGFAVLKVDLRGHGKSIYNVNLDKKYWQNLSQKAFAKYPEDVYGLLQYVKEEYKNVSLAHYAVVGADIGASTAVLTAQKMAIKPFALVLISPQSNFKGLYMPVSLVDLPTTNLLFVYSKQDVNTVKEVVSIKRFAQAKTYELSTTSGGSGMMLLKSNPKLKYDVINWCVKEFNSYVDSYTLKKNEAVKK